MMTELHKGDRVTIIITARRRSDRPLTMHGQIIGETRSQHAWIVKRDDVKTPCAYHKDFCHPEERHG